MQTQMLTTLFVLEKVWESITQLADQSEPLQLRGILHFHCGRKSMGL